MSMTNEQAIERMNDMQERIISWYLDKIDWDMSAYMNEDEKKEYNALYKQVYGTCYFCGEDTKACHCDL
jgi:hypothetical protein